jgi:hypothetical protein
MDQLRVTPLPVFEPFTRPELTITIAPATLQEVGGFHDSAGVNDLMVLGDVTYLVGESGLDAADLTDLGSPQRVGQLALGGSCGPLTSPSAPHTAGALRTPSCQATLPIDRRGPTEILEEIS